MNFEEKLCRYYERLLSGQARQMGDSLVRKCIRNLKKCKKDSGMCLSGDDGLENLWDEICVQVQGEQSMHWEAYLDYVTREIHRLAEAQFSQKDLEILWLQTDAFHSWWADASFPEEDQEAFLADGTPSKFLQQDVEDYLLGELLSAAANYTNQRIEKYLL